MTYAEKYLKVSTKEFENAIINTIGDIGGLYSLEKWLDTKIKPTLTEDERVILRNIPTKYWQKICRDNFGVLEIRGEYEKVDFHVINISDFDEYNHLFRFIKERRRIFY